MVFILQDGTISLLALLALEYIFDMTRRSWILVFGLMFLCLLSWNVFTPIVPPAQLTSGGHNLNGPPRVLPYSEMLKHVKNREIDAAVITGNTVKGRFHNGGWFVSSIPDAKVADQLTEGGAQVWIDTSEPNLLLALLMPLLQLFLIFGLIMFMSKGGTAGRIMGISKSRAKLLNEVRGKVTFKDVAGVEEAKQELEEVVEFLKNPSKFTQLGGKIPKGVLLVGPPGTGKTLLARAVAGEANVPFFTTTGSDFVEMFVGVGASRVRDMFQQAKKNAPCIIFIDEIDAVGRHRGAGLGGGNDEREQTLNQMLVEMDGFESSDGIILIAATNRPDVLDPALLRPGRFDRQVVVGLPDVVGRQEVLKVHVQKVPLAADVSIRDIAKGTPGFSGADLANLVNEAVLFAARKEHQLVQQSDFEAAKDKVLMGVERRSLAMTEEEKTRTAYHEAGHAILSIRVPGNDPLHKVTIVPRGRALGVTISLPDKDRLGWTEHELRARLVMFYGGRIAEELIYGKENVSTGASNDLLQVSQLARKMVTEWGMSDSLGALRYAEPQEEVFLGRSISRTQHLSEATANQIDCEVRKIAILAEEKAHQILTEYRHELVSLANALLEYETLTATEVLLVLQGQKILRTSETFQIEKDSQALQSSPVLNPGIPL